MMLHSQTVGKAQSASTALMSKRAPCSMYVLSFRKLVKPHWQTAAPFSMTSHSAGRMFCFTSKTLAAGRSPWSAAGLNKTQPCSAILSPLEKTGTTLPTPAQQAQENSTRASTASQKQQFRKRSGLPGPEKCIFKCQKHHKNSWNRVSFFDFF